MIKCEFPACTKEYRIPFVFVRSRLSSEQLVLQHLGYTYALKIRPTIEIAAYAATSDHMPRLSFIFDIQ